MVKKLTLRSLTDLWRAGEILTWLTCYDYSFAKILNETELDLILVGDSGGMVLLGYSDTVPVKMDEMISMCLAVKRGAPNKFIVGDMPKGSYEKSNELAVDNAMRFVKEAGVDAIKLEGGSRMKERVRAICDSGIPVIGHIGLTPQSSAAFGGYRVVGKLESEIKVLISDFIDLQKAGACSILIEATPPIVGKRLKEVANIPIFGIGAGPDLDGQLLILHDLIGLYPDFRPKFAKNYIPDQLSKFNNFLQNQGDLLLFGRTTRRDGIFELCRLAVENYIKDCKEKTFPSNSYIYE